MKKIMVVDDDKDLLVAVKGFLKREGYDVIVTTSCREGTDILTSFKPNLIFLDINVPLFQEKSRRFSADFLRHRGI